MTAAHRRSLVLTAALTGLLVLWSGCTPDPAVQQAKHVARAEAYMADAKYPEAVIEYRNALKLAPNDPQTHFRLGLAYLGQGTGSHASQAFAALSQAVKLDPTLLDAQLKLGELLILGRRFDAAKTKATLVLETDPRRLDALLLLASSELGAGHLDAARQAVAAAKAAHPQDPRPWLTEAAIHASVRQLPAAEQALREADRLAPTSVGPTLALGNLYRIQGKRAEAERQYRKAVTLTPDDLGPYMTLAQFYVASGDLTKADGTFQDAIKTFPKQEAVRLNYAQFLIARRDLDGAVEQYRTVLKDHPRDVAARKQLAGLLMDLGRSDDARPLIDDLRADRRGDADVLYLSARLLIIDKAIDTAVTTLKEALAADPNHAKAHQELGRLFAMRGDLQQAKAEFAATVNAQPTAWDARLALADLHIRSKAPDLALEETRAVLTAIPRYPPALRLAGDALFASGKTREALEQYDTLIAAAPTSPIGYFRKGIVYRVLGKPDEAEKQFAKALDRAPGSPEVLNQVVALLLQRKDRSGAIALLTTQIEKTDRKAPLHHLLGMAYAAMDDSGKAEAQLKLAITLDKTYLPAYVALGRLYDRGRDPEKVIAQYRAMIDSAPANPSPHMLLGMAYESQQRYDDAMAEYERALKLEPRFAPAANNLAWLYAERGKNIDVALNLAQTAMEQLPDDPGVADTLGWLYYKKRAYVKAIALLRDASDKLPDSAVVHYHLGMAYAKNGDAPAAKRTLDRALALDPQFPGHGEAKQALADLHPQ